MHRLCPGFSVAVWLHISLAYAQTITKGNETVAANASTVAPAAEIVSGNGGHLEAETIQLTDAVIANLTALSLTNISVFDFAADSSSASNRTVPGGCKTFPGDGLWPDDSVWETFDLLTGGALVRTVPLASPCYDSWGNYDSGACDHITDQWTNSSLHETDPTSVMSPLYQGLTCVPANDSQTGTCILGGYPSYSVNVSTVAQIQLATNFARNLNLRFVVKNTGHDFCGRSAGAGALSVWTHHMKGLEFHEDYTTTNYSGPAIKAGAGIQGFELYEFADQHGVVAVGGECKTVGWAGGFIAGGGHSPLTPLYGLAADQILSVDVVTPDGRFVTADDTQNTDLLWALSGGGGNTFGVVTSYTVKVYPDFPVVSYMDLTIAATGNTSVEAFWSAVEAYILYVPTLLDARNYMYWFLLDSGYPELIFRPWFAPGMTVAELQNLTAPLFDTWARLGVSASPEYHEYYGFLAAYNAGFPQEAVASNTSKATSRLVPRDNLVDPTRFNATFSAIRQFYDLGGQFVGYGITGGPSGLEYPDNAVNPAWRDAALHLLPCRFWDASSTVPEIAAYSGEMTASWLQAIRDATPGSGAYASEGDVNEPDFKQSFYGLDKYERLYGIKQKYDPTGLFYANKGVGSDEWYVTDQLQGLPTQNGRLCRVSG